MNTYEYFLDNEEAYSKRGDPWTFSALLYGMPGCGKTSLIKAIVNHASDRNEILHVFLISFTDVTSPEMFTQMIFDINVNGHHIPLRQRILIFEDFDAGPGMKVFQKRQERADDDTDDTLQIILDRLQPEDKVSLSLAKITS